MEEFDALGWDAWSLRCLLAVEVEMSFEQQEVQAWSLRRKTPCMWVWENSAHVIGG